MSLHHQPIRSSSTKGSPDRKWFAVRCIFQSTFDDGYRYQERVTLWQANGFEGAFTLAVSEAKRYAKESEVAFLGLAQAYQLPGPPGNGAVVFSLIRDSDLAPKYYLNRFFDSGRERQKDSDQL